MSPPFLIQKEGDGGGNQVCKAIKKNKYRLVNKNTVFGTMFPLNNLI